jgi:SAM-dependent methyltransferase
MESDIKDHYNSDDLFQRIEAAFLKANKDLSRLEIKDLAPVDQLHTGGARASMEFFKKIGFVPDGPILDAGCGIGGTSRLLAKQFDCRVTGLDLADRFVEAARCLTQWTGLEDQVVFQQGSVLDLPFESGSFDAVLCQHLLMNIQDKPKAVKEFFRILKPGGKLLLQEITKGDNDDLALPVPWAAKKDISFLEPWDILEKHLNGQGFLKAYFSDETRGASLFWEKVRAVSLKRTPLPGSLGPGLIFGDNAHSFGKNMAANFENNSICLVEAVFKKSYDG